MRRGLQPGAPRARHPGRRRIRRGLRTLALAPLCVAAAATAWGGVLTWDPDGAGPGLGGDGAWSDPGVWFDGTAHGAWAAGSSAVLGGTAGTVLLTNNASLETLQVDVPGYIVDIAGSTPTLTVKAFTGSENLRFDNSGTTTRRIFTIRTTGRVPFLGDFSQSGGGGLTATFTGGTCVLERATAFTGCYSLTAGMGTLLLNSPSLLQAMHLNAYDGGVLGGTGAVAELTSAIGKQLAIRPGGVLAPGDPEANGGIGRLTLAIQVECLCGTNALGAPAAFQAQVASPTVYDQLVLIGTNVGAREAFDCAVGTEPVAPVLDVQIASNFTGGAAGDFLCLIDNQTTGVLNSVAHTFGNAPNFAAFGFTNALGTPYWFQYRYNVDKDAPLEYGNDFGLSILSIGDTNAPAPLPRDLPAQTLMWDADGPGPGIGGSGAWTNHWSWWNGSCYTNWFDGGDALFGGTAGMVVMQNAHRTIGTFQVDTPGYVFDNAGFSSGRTLTVSNYVGSEHMLLLTTTTNGTRAVSFAGATDRVHCAADFRGDGTYRFVVNMAGPTIVLDRPVAYDPTPWYTFYVQAGTCLWNSAHIPLERMSVGNENPGTPLGVNCVLGGTGSVAAAGEVGFQYLRIDPGAVLAPGDPAVNGGIGALTLSHLLQFERGPGPDTNSVFRVQVATPASYDQVILVGSNRSAVAYPVDLSYLPVGVTETYTNAARIDVDFGADFDGAPIGTFLCFIDNQVTNIASGKTTINGTFANAPADALLGVPGPHGVVYMFQYKYNVDKDNPAAPGNDFGLLLAAIYNGMVLLVR